VPHGTHNFVFNQSGDALYAFAGAAGVFKIDPEQGRVLAHAETASPVRGLGWTADNQSLMAAVRGELLLLAPSDLKIVRQIEVPGAAQLFYPIAMGERILAPGGPDGAFYVIDANTGATLREIQTGRTPIIVQVGSDRRAYVSNVQDDHLSVIDLETFSVAKIDNLGGPNGLGFSRCPASF
jgi:YVTN family beta-propeller protein